MGRKQALKGMLSLGVGRWPLQPEWALNAGGVNDWTLMYVPANGIIWVAEARGRRDARRRSRAASLNSWAYLEEYELGLTLKRLFGEEPLEAVPEDRWD